MRARLVRLSLGVAFLVLATPTGVAAQVACPDGSYVAEGPCRMCPDGTWVGSGARCELTPGGRYVPEQPGGARVAPDGRYVPGGGRMLLCPDGRYVAGERCVLAPDGRYVGAPR